MEQYPDLNLGLAISEIKLRVPLIPGCGASSRCDVGRSIYAVLPYLEISRFYVQTWWYSTPRLHLDYYR